MRCEGGGDEKGEGPLLVNLLMESPMLKMS